MRDFFPVGTSDVGVYMALGGAMFGVASGLSENAQIELGSHSAVEYLRTVNLCLI